MALKIKESFDTNIILRLMLKDIPGQCCRLQDLFMRANIQYHVADLAITEAVYVMESNYRLSREKIVDGMRVRFARLEKDVWKEKRDRIMRLIEYVG